uniref:Uncharacterized protein n=1 Tax=Panagrolaimus davidi TaxID=227884 RepID=A0A914Q6N3_9BILA
MTSKVLIICCIFMLLNQEIDAGIFHKDKTTPVPATPAPMGWNKDAIAPTQWQPPKNKESKKKAILKNAIGGALTGAAAAGAIAAIKHKKNP